MDIPVLAGEADFRPSTDIALYAKCLEALIPAVIDFRIPATTPTKLTRCCTVDIPLTVVMQPQLCAVTIGALKARGALGGWCQTPWEKLIEERLTFPQSREGPIALQPNVHTVRGIGFKGNPPAAICGGVKLALRTMICQLTDMFPSNAIIGLGDVQAKTAGIQGMVDR